MSNGDAPGSQTPPPSSEANKPKGCLALLGSLGSPIRIRFLGMEFEGPLGIGLTLLLGFFVAYLGILLWVVPRRVPVLSDPLIDAALTAQPTRPPLPRLVVVDRSPQDTQYCVKPGDTVLLRIEPTPDPTKPGYLVDDLWTGIHLEQRSWGEWQFKVEGKKPGDYFVLMLYEVNEKGERGYGISRATFSVQEECK